MTRRYTSSSPLVSGETVTPGTFICLECGHRHEVRESVVNLPVCPRCQNETWRLK